MKFQNQLIKKTIPVLLAFSLIMNEQFVSYCEKVHSALKDVPN